MNEDDELIHKGVFKSAIIQKIINKMWFATRNDEGVVHHSFFKPIRIQTHALVLSVVRLVFQVGHSF